jgi:hypothetical protein
MNNELYNKRGLTFRGAFVVVIFVHVVGAFSLYGYTKYRSNQLKIAREEWRNKLIQKDCNQNEWKESKVAPKIVARTIPKAPAEKKINVAASDLINNAQDSIKPLLDKATTEVTSAWANRAKWIETNKKKPLQNTLPLPKPVVNKSIETRVHTHPIANKSQAASSATPPVNKPFVNVYPQQKPKISNTVRSVPPPRPLPSPEYVYESKEKITTDEDQYNRQLRSRIDVDNTTQEVIRTFYSY